MELSQILKEILGIMNAYFSRYNYLFIFLTLGLLEKLQMIEQLGKAKQKHKPLIEPLWARECFTCLDPVINKTLSLTGRSSQSNRRVTAGR